MTNKKVFIGRYGEYMNLVWNRLSLRKGGKPVTKYSLIDLTALGKLNHSRQTEIGFFSQPNWVCVIYVSLMSLANTVRQMLFSLNLAKSSAWPDPHIRDLRLRDITNPNGLEKTPRQNRKPVLTIRWFKYSSDVNSKKSVTKIWTDLPVCKKKQRNRYENI